MNRQDDLDIQELRGKPNAYLRIRNSSPMKNPVNLENPVNPVKLI